MLNFPDYFLRTLYGHGSVDVKLTLKQAMGSRCISLLFLEPRRYGGGFGGDQTQAASVSETRYRLCKRVMWLLTLKLLMSYIYGAPSKARNANVVYIWTYVWQR